MKYLSTAMLMAFCGTGSIQATVVTSTTCGVGTQSTSNPTNCSINSQSNVPPNTVASAAANITINQLTPVSNGGPFTNFTLYVTGSATAIPVSNIGSGPNISANAASTANIAYQFSTPGPVRQGVITYYANAVNFQTGPGNDGANAAVSVGSLPTFSCGYPEGCPGLNFPPHSQSFTLGNTFNFNFSEAFQAYGDPYAEGPGFAGGGIGFDFQLFEADGKTPVAISAAPEPGTLGLLLTCLGGVGAVCALRRTRRLFEN